MFKMESDKFEMHRPSSLTFGLAKSFDLAARV
jgi:hypothetical protein